MFAKTWRDGPRYFKKDYNNFCHIPFQYTFGKRKSGKKRKPLEECLMWPMFLKQKQSVLSPTARRHGGHTPCILEHCKVVSFTLRIVELFHLPTLMHNSLLLNKCMLHYYPRHVSSINMPIFRRTNFIHPASGIVALCKRLYSTLVECRPVYCAAVYRERRYQMLCEYNWSSWRWAC